MPVEASGIVSMPLENLRILVTHCSEFRRWTGTEDVDAARTRAHLNEPKARPSENRTYSKDELAELWPFCVIDEFVLPFGEPGADAWVVKRNALNSFVGSGKLLLSFEDVVIDDDRDNNDEARLRFMNNVGAVLEQICELGNGETEYLSIQKITRWHPYCRSDESVGTTQGDFYRVSYVLDWGSEVKTKVRAEWAETPSELMERIGVAATRGLEAAVRYWHQNIMPGHFTVEGGKKYGYQPRRGDDEPPYIERMTRWSVDAQHQRLIRVKNPAYSWRERREKRHNKPLVWSGESERTARAGVRISSRTQNGNSTIETSAAMTLPKYFYAYRTTDSRKEYRGWGSGSFQRDIAGTHQAPDKAAELTATTRDEVVLLDRIASDAAAAVMEKAPSRRRTLRVA